MFFYFFFYFLHWFLRTFPPPLSSLRGIMWLWKTQRVTCPSLLLVHSGARVKHHLNSKWVYTRVLSTTSSRRGGDKVFSLSHSNKQHTLNFLLLRKLTPFLANMGKHRATSCCLVAVVLAVSFTRLNGHDADNSLSPVCPSFVLTLTKGQMPSTHSRSVGDGCLDWSIYLWIEWASDRLVLCTHSSHSMRCFRASCPAVMGKAFHSPNPNPTAEFSHTHSRKICLRKQGLQSPRCRPIYFNKVAYPLRVPKKLLSTERGQWCHFLSCLRNSDDLFCQSEQS